MANKDKYNPLYSPYGAFELKAKYQRNFTFATLIALGLVLTIIGSAVLYKILTAADEAEIIAAPVVIQTIRDIPPPPQIERRPPKVQVQQQVQVPKVGIPTPVADDELMDEDVVIATQQELADISVPTFDQGAGPGDDLVIDIQEDFIPAPEDFVPLEIQPEMLERAQPDYPQLARQAGLTGTVAVQGLVNPKGEVQDVKIARSSGVESLDLAAEEAAYKCKFKPGIQNGNPVFVWVVWTYEFTLN